MKLAAAARPAKLDVRSLTMCDHEIPIRTHMRLVVAQFAYMQAQNIAFRLGMPMSIVLVLKNGGLVAQMLVGTFLLGGREILIYP